MLEIEKDQFKAEGKFLHLSDHPFGTIYAVSLLPNLYEYICDNWLLRKLSDEYVCHFKICQKQANQHRTMTSDSKLIFPHHDYSGVYTFGVIIYTSQTWSIDQGGEFVAMASYKPNSKDVIVEPLSNLALFFFNCIENVHKVNPLLYGERDSLVVEWNIKLAFTPLFY